MHPIPQKQQDFSDITKKQLNEVINNIIDKPEKLKGNKGFRGQ